MGASGEEVEVGGLWWLDRCGCFRWWVGRFEGVGLMS